MFDPHNSLMQKTGPYNYGHFKMRKLELRGERLAATPHTGCAIYSGRNVQVWSGLEATCSILLWWPVGRRKTAGVRCPRARAEDWEATWVGPQILSLDKGSSETRHLQSWSPGLLW